MRKLCYNAYIKFRKFWCVKMNWLNHEYLVPIILGNGKEERAFARDIKRATGLLPYIFAEKFDFFQRFYASCQLLYCADETIRLMSISAFLDKLEDYAFPVLIYGRDFKDFVARHAEALEERLILCDINDASGLLNGDK